MKTRKEHLKVLPKNIYNKAVINAKNCNCATELLDRSSKHNALDGFFIWHETPEGWDYWNNLNIKYFAKKLK